MKEPTAKQLKMYISRPQYIHLSFEVCASIHRSYSYSRVLPNDLTVVGIANGGTLFADYLAAGLKIPLVLVHPNFMPIPTSALDLLEDRKILLVDDISDSGETLRVWRDYLTSKGCSVQIATLFARAGTRVPPDFVGQRIEGDDWLVFWWEPEYVWTKEDIEREHII